jgi:hypothetical protein
MPHDSPWLNDYQLKLKADELQRKSEEDKVFNTQNAALRAAINCPLPLRKPSDCRNCGNEECVNAYKEQNKLWPENACDEPAFPANPRRQQYHLQNQGRRLRQSARPLANLHLVQASSI